MTRCLRPMEDCRRWRCSRLLLPRSVVRNEKPRLTAEPTVVPRRYTSPITTFPTSEPWQRCCRPLRPPMELGQEAASVPVPVVGWAQVMAPASVREAAVASVVVFLKSVAAFQLLSLFPLLIPNTQRKHDEPRARELASF